MTGLEGMWFGNFRVLRRIGGGGMGDIYLAEQPNLGRQVAIKVVRGEGTVSGPEAFNEQSTQQFLQEARAIAALEHPNILPLYDYGEQAGIHYLIMPYVAQGSLADIIEARSPATPTNIRIALPAPTALTAEIVAQTAAGLQYAHERGIVHRDVKPQNLLVRRLSAGPLADDIAAEATHPGTVLLPPYLTDTSSPASSYAIATLTPAPDQIHVLLADFGLARFMSALVGRTGTAGTPLYNAPEQYSGYPVPATDQYALACVAYLLLTGRPVFEGTIVELHHQHLMEAPAGVTRYNPHLPPAADTVILRALAKDPKDRYPTIREFAAALRAAINPLGQGGQTPWPRQHPLGGVHLVASAASSPPSNDLDPTADTRPSLELPAIQIPGNPGNPGNLTPSQPSAPFLPAVTPLSIPGMGQPYITPSSTPTSNWLPPYDTYGMPAPNSQRLTAPPPVRMPSGSSRQHSDANPTELPAAAKRRGTMYDLLNEPSLKRWRSAIIALVVVVVVASIGSIAIIRTHQGQKTSNTPITYTGTGSLQGISQTLSRAGVVNLIAGKPLTQMPRNQGHFSVRADRTNESAVSLPALPSQAATTSAPPPANYLKGDYQTLGHVTQGDVGIVAPMSVSAQSNSQFLLQTVDGILQVIALQNAVLLQPQRYALADIFAPVLHTNDQLGQSRVFFDSRSQHWVLIANELTIAPDGNPTRGYFDIAVSQSANQVVAWNIYQISTTPATKTCTWADNPQLGNDDTTYYLTGTELTCGTSRQLSGAVLWALPKDALAQGHTATAVFWTGFNVASNSPAYTLTPAQEQQGASAGLLLSSLSGYVDGTSTSRLLKAWAVVHAPQAAPSKQMSIIAATLTLPAPYADPVAAAQPGATSGLATGDARVTSAVYANGHLYAALTTAVNWRGDAQTRTAAYWLDATITTKANTSDAAASSLTASLAQGGIYGFPGGYVFDPTLAVDANSDLIMVANISSVRYYPSVGVAERHKLDVPNSFNQGQPFSFLARGLKSFTAGRWGDYTSAYYSAANNAFLLAAAYTNLSTAAWATSVWQIPALP